MGGMENDRVRDLESDRQSDKVQMSSLSER
jgi:hypothetical protein